MKSKSDSQKGFTLVEILVGILILSLAIMTFSAALRQAYQWKLRQRSYERVYMAANSIIDELVSVETDKDVTGSQTGTGKMNGIEYTWRCRPFVSNKNFSFSSEDPTQSGNNGRFQVTLQKCTLALTGEDSKRMFTFFRTLFCCPEEDSDRFAYGVYSP